MSQARYNAFVSYSHEASSRFAPQLERAIQQFAKPWFKFRMLNIFRDESNLNLSPDLWRSIETALDDSEFLIYLAHPAAARSFWIDKEIGHWIATKGVSKLILVITAGDFSWDPHSNQLDRERTDVLPPALQQALRNEPLYLDLRWAASMADFDQDPRFHSAVAILAATLRKTSVEDITGEEWAQHRKRIRYRNVAIASLAVLALAALGFAWYAGEQEKSATARNFTLRSAAALAAGDPTRAALLAADAWNMRPDDTARGALINAFYHQSFRYRDRLYATPFYAIAHKSSESDSTLALAGDGNRFVSYAGGALEVFDRTGKKIAGFDADWSARPSALAMAHDGSAVCAGAANGDLLLAFPDTAGLQTSWKKKPQAAFIHCAFSADRTKVAFAADDGRAHVWRTDGTYLLSTPQGESKLLRVSFARNDHSLVTVSFGKADDAASGAVSIWSLDYASGGATLQASLGACAACTDAHSDRISSAELSANGDFLITASVDKTAKIWRLGDEVELVAVLGGHLDSVESAHFSAGEQHIVTTSSDQTIGLWRWDQQARLATKIVSLLGHGNWVADARLQADGNSAISISRDGTVRYWFVTGRPLPRVTSEQRAVKKLVYAADGARVLTLGDGPLATLWTETASYPLSPAGGTLLSAAFAPSGDLIATGSAGGVVDLWDSGGRHRRRIQKAGFQSRILDVAFSADGTQLVTASTDTEADIWSTAGEHRITLSGHQGAVNAVTFSPDQQHVLTGSHDRTLKLFSAATGELIASAAHEDAVLSVDFSPDGAQIVSASMDATARLWDAALSPLRELRHSKFVYRAQFSADGRHILTTSWDGRVRFWSIEGELLGVINAVPAMRIEPDPGLHAAFIPRKSGIAVIVDGQPLEWDIDGQRLADGVRSREAR